MMTIETSGARRALGASRSRSRGRIAAGRVCRHARSAAAPPAARKRAARPAGRRRRGSRREDRHRTHPRRLRDRRRRRGAPASSRLRPARNSRCRSCCSSTSASAWNPWSNGRSCGRAVEQWFVTRLAPQDRVQVGSFAKQISIGPPLAGNPRALLAAVRKALDPREADTLGPSPNLGRGRRRRHGAGAASGRRAVVLVTDGRGDRQPAGSGGSRRTRAVAAGVAVSVVGEDWEMTIRQDGTDRRPRAPRRGARVDCERDRRAVRCGIRRFLPTPGPILERLLADLHARYTLGFTAPDRRRQDARSRRPRQPPGVKLRSRGSYLAPLNSER